MEGAFFVIALFGFALVAGLMAYGSYLSAKKRREGMARVAAGRGWTYQEQDDAWCYKFDCPPFGIGFGEKSLNIVGGTHDGRRFVAYDYWYSTHEGSGKNRRTVHHPYSIVGISTKVVFPRLSVTPEGWFGRMVGRITGNDIEMESEDFNRAFTVSGEDRKFATDVLHPRMMELLLRTPDLGWTLVNGTLLVATPGQHDLVRLDALLAGIDRIIDTFPELVWKQAGVEDPGAAPPSAPPATA